MLTGLKNLKINVSLPDEHVTRTNGAHTICVTVDFAYYRG